MRSRNSVLSALTSLVLLGLMGTTVGAGPANATLGERTSAPSTVLEGSEGRTVVTHQRDPQCVSARVDSRRSTGASVPASACDVTIVATTSAPRHLSAGEAAAARSIAMLPADVSPVYSRSYRYTVYQGTDQENMKGTFFYDGYHVWQSTSYRGHVGSRSCWVSYSITYSIEIKACTGGSISTSSISAHMQLWVTLAKWTPISWREDYYVTMTPYGSTSIRKA